MSPPSSTVQDQRQVVMFIAGTVMAILLVYEWCGWAADEKYAVVRLPSGEQRSVLSHCTATVGAVSNPQHKNTKLGKAGASRWLGRRPVVRGMAMNPVDHPHGGGRGKRKGRISQTPWGVPTKGFRTRKSTRTDQYIRLSRHKAA